MVNKKEGLMRIHQYLRGEYLRYLSWVEEHEAVKQSKLTKDPNAFVGAHDQLIDAWNKKAEELKKMMDFCNSLIDEEMSKEDDGEETDLCS